MSPLQEVPPIAAGRVQSGGAVDHAGRSVTILVIDDREDVADAIADLCRSQGVPAVISHEGEAVHDMLRRHRPAGVIVDVMMPNEDGFEAMKEIAGYDCNLPVLLITGRGETWLQLGSKLGHAHGLKTVDTSPKPIRMPTLGRFIEAVRANQGANQGAQYS